MKNANATFGSAVGLRPLPLESLVDAGVTMDEDTPDIYAACMAFTPSLVRYIKDKHIVYLIIPMIPSIWVTKCPTLQQEQELEMLKNIYKN